jgi:beta-N-acetylhexosaminidase
VPPGEVAARAHVALAERAARLALRAEGPPPAGGEGLLAVMVRSHTSPLDPPEQPLGEALRTLLPGVQYHEVNAETSDTALALLRDRAAEASCVLLALVVKPAAWHAFGLPPELEALAKRVVDGRPSAVAALGAPVALEGFEGAEARLVTFSDTPVAQRALAWRLSAG